MSPAISDLVIMVFVGSLRARSVRRGVHHPQECVRTARTDVPAAYFSVVIPFYGELIKCLPAEKQRGVRWPVFPAWLLVNDCFSLFR